MVIFYAARIFKIIKMQSEMWETVLKTIKSEFGFKGTLIGCLGKKIQLEKNQHGGINWISIFGEGKNIQFLVQSFTPAGLAYAPKEKYLSPYNVPYRASFKST